MKHCESCGQFVSKSTLPTVRYCYEIHADASIVVYGSSTATRRISQVLCRSCARCAHDFRILESLRDYEVVFDRRRFPAWSRRRKVA